MATAQVVAAARLVRAAALAFAISLMVGFIAVQAFASQYGEPANMVVLDATHTDGELSDAIAVQTAAGLTCSEKPVLTDVILFQRDTGQKVTVMTFAQAIGASSAHSGWIRRYCV